jgi:hypothetical protein
MRHLLPILAAVALWGCQLTDHSERTEVTTEDIQFGRSGYEEVDPGELPRIEFQQREQDMGRVVQGAKVEKRFVFTNSGKSPLVISDVRSTCGCTVGKEWPKTPIAPGEGGEVTVSFDSEGRTGAQHKTITVVANTEPASTVLTLKGEVVGPTPAQ